MAANVFLGIIPAQKRFVAAVARGPHAGCCRRRARQITVHSHNYLTLPVVLCMISNHYPMLYGHPQGWLLLIGLARARLAPALLQPQAPGHRATDDPDNERCYRRGLRLRDRDKTRHTDARGRRDRFRGRERHRRIRPRHDALLGMPRRAASSPVSLPRQADIASNRSRRCARALSSRAPRSSRTTCRSATSPE